MQLPQQSDLSEMLTYTHNVLSNNIKIIINTQNVHVYMFVFVYK